MLFKRSFQFATKQEIKEYNFFNIIINKIYKITIGRKKECCIDEVKENWNYCPFCGKKVGEYNIYINDVDDEQKAIKKAIKNGYQEEEIKEVIVIFNIELAMTKKGE